jgi:hypothetical protein
LVGPGLKDIEKRRAFKWIFAFTKNPSKLMQDGDVTAISVYKRYKKIQMPAYPTITEQLMTDKYSFKNIAN